MARQILILALATVIGCGGGDEPSPPPPPPPAVPAAIGVQSGDGQAAEPGSVVPVRPAVIVRTSAGAPVAGVTVQFAVDTGGGTVQGGTATTGADGVATVGGWTLGPAEGRQVLIVTATGLPSVRIAATANFPLVVIVPTQPVPASGGTLRNPQAAAPFDRIELQVPGGAYRVPTQWTVTARRSASIPLPEGATLAGPVVTVTNGQGYADSVMSLTIPTTSDPDVPVGAFYYDSATRWLEPVPIGDRGDSTVTIAVRHFSAASLLMPASGASSRVFGATAAAPAFGQVVLIVVAVRPTVLARPVTSSFQPGRDDWEFTNRGSVAQLGGICAGMSMTALYYNYRYAPSMGFLNGRFDDIDDYDYDNPQGIRFASDAQSDAAVGWQTMGLVWFKQVNNLAIATHRHPDLVTFNSIVVSLFVTGRGMILDMRGGTVAHAVVVYEARANGILIADVNTPGQSRLVQFANGRFLPLPFSARAGGNQTPMTGFIVMGATSMVNLLALDAEWLKFSLKLAGATTFPAYQLQFLNKLTRAWTTVTSNTATVFGDTLVGRVTCPTCPFKLNGIVPADRQPLDVVDYIGSFLGQDDANPVGAEIPLDSTSQKFGFYRQGWNQNAAGQFLDFGWVTVRSVPTRIDRLAPAVVVDSIEPFAVRHRGTHPPNALYRWIFSDGNPPDTVRPAAGDTTVVYRFRRVGNYKVKVEVEAPAGTLIGLDSVTAKADVLNEFVWSLRAATLQGSTLPPGGIGLERSDTLIYNKVTSILARLLANPRDNAFFVIGTAFTGPTCDAVAGLEQFPVGQVSVRVVPTAVFALLATCGDPDFTGSLKMGTLGNGTVVGSALPVPNPNLITLPGGSVSATMAGKNVTGTLVWNVRYSAGLGTYTVTFQGVQVTP